MRRTSKVDRKKFNGKKQRTSYDKGYHVTYAEAAYRLTLLGANNAVLARVFKVAPQTIEFWCRRHPEFQKAIKDGKEEADAQVAKSIYHRACGYSHPDYYITTVRIKDQSGNERIQLIKEPIVKYYPPDTAACIFWLKNRQRQWWRDSYRQELTGRDDGPIRHRLETPLDLSSLTDEELAIVENIGLKLLKGQS